MKYKLIGKNNFNNPVDTILENRNITRELFTIDKAVIEDYNNYDNMQEGIELLLKHLDNDSKIEFVGDADVDGMTSFAMLYNYIKEIYPESNLNLLIHTGKFHGLSKDITISEDTNLVICPDGATNDFEKHKELHNKGIDILILDHHECDMGYSKYATVINNQLSESIKNKELCGAGVVMKFLKALDDYLFEDKSNYYMDLCALGNVADMMNLKSEETRYYVYEGIKNINNLFLKALMETNKFELEGKYNIDKIGWVIAPKLNGTIRSGSQEEKLQMFNAFTSNDYEYCLEVAKMCKSIKSTQDRAVKTGMKNITKLLTIKPEDKCLILGISNKIEQPHTGLIAQKLSDKYRIPTLLYRDVKNKKGYISGSFRGINSITTDLRNDLLNSKLVEYSQGHPNAGGYEIHKDKLPNLKKYLNDLYKDKEIIDGKEYEVDFILKEEDIDNKVIEPLANLEDEFGNGIDFPLILFENINLELDNSNSKGKLNIVFYVNNVKFIKKYASNALKEELYYKNIKTNIIGKCTMDTYYNTCQVEIMDIEVI